MTSLNARTKLETMDLLPDWGALSAEVCADTRFQLPRISLRVLSLCARGVKSVVLKLIAFSRTTDYPQVSILLEGIRYRARE